MLVLTCCARSRVRLDGNGHGTQLKPPERCCGETVCCRPFSDAQLPLEHPDSVVESVVKAIAKSVVIHTYLLPNPLLGLTLTAATTLGLKKRFPDCPATLGRVRQSRRSRRPARIIVSPFHTKLDIVPTPRPIIPAFFCDRCRHTAHSIHSAATVCPRSGPLPPLAASGPRCRRPPPPWPTHSSRRR